VAFLHGPVYPEYNTIFFRNIVLEPLLHFITHLPHLEIMAQVPACGLEQQQGTQQYGNSQFDTTDLVSGKSIDI